MPQTLLDRVSEARTKLAEKTLSVSALGALLTDVETYLTTPLAAPDPNQQIDRAVRNLSYSELEAIQHIAAALPETETGLLVAYRIADACGITRSVIVNGLRKLQSAGVIDTRSLGTKGTHIKTLTPGWTKRLDYKRVA